MPRLGLTYISYISNSYVWILKNKTRLYWINYHTANSSIVRNLHVMVDHEFPMMFQELIVISKKLFMIITSKFIKVVSYIIAVL